MAQVITKLTNSKIVTELDTYNYTVLTTGMHKVSIDVSEIPSSSIIVTILKNGSPVVSTTVAPAAAQQVISLAVVQNNAVSDVIGITLASSSDNDKGPNRFKAILTINRVS